jgi:nucleoside-diphosphate-sugar epimerase
VKTVLVTGAAGFLGRHTLAPLAARGYTIHAVVRPGGAIPDGLDERIAWHRADLLNPDEVERLTAAAGASHLLHLAWDVQHGSFWTSSANLDWVVASLKLFDAFSNRGGRRIVAAGTCAEYDWTAAMPCREDVSPLRPSTIYGRSKLALSLLLESFSEGRGLSAAWARLFLLYGPWEHPDRLVAHVARSLVAGRPVAVSSGTQVRDLLHVADAGAAMAAVLDSSVTGPINVASGEPRTLREVLDAMSRRAVAPGLVQFNALRDRPGEPAVLTADVNRLTTEVVWTPALSMAQGLSDTIDWWANRAHSAPA